MKEEMLKLKKKEDRFFNFVVRLTLMATSINNLLDSSKISPHRFPNQH